jgi:DNA-binding CsgD family transcriptional regulator
MGRALYQQGELHRLAGELDRADEAYRRAGELGFEPQPGVSLLRLAQGERKAAVASIRRVAGEAGSPQGPGAGVQRLEVLGPFAEIMVAIGELKPARAAADELATIAREMSSPFVSARAAGTNGAVLLAEGDAKEALVALREAWTSWQSLEAPYEAARVRVLIAAACEQLGDSDTAAMHRDAAAAVFERLGATPDLSRLRGDDHSTAAPITALSKRELEVLPLLASGKTNRQIAAELGISEHTVARHVSNIFDKLGVSSRTAASAFAYEHDLV